MATLVNKNLLGFPLLGFVLVLVVAGLASSVAANPSSSNNSTFSEYGNLITDSTYTYPGKESTKLRSSADFDGDGFVSRAEAEFTRTQLKRVLESNQLDLLDDQLPTYRVVERAEVLNLEGPTRSYERLGDVEMRARINLTFGNATDEATHMYSYNASLQNNGTFFITLPEGFSVRKVSGASDTEELGPRFLTGRYTDVPLMVTFGKAREHAPLANVAAPGLLFAMVSVAIAALWAAWCGACRG